MKSLFWKSISNPWNDKKKKIEWQKSTQDSGGPALATPTCLTRVLGFLYVHNSLLIPRLNWGMAKIWGGENGNYVLALIHLRLSIIKKYIFIKNKTFASTLFPLFWKPTVKFFRTFWVNVFSKIEKRFSKIICLNEWHVWCPISHSWYLAKINDVIDVIFDWHYFELWT